MLCIGLVSDVVLYADIRDMEVPEWGFEGNLFEETAPALPAPDPQPSHTQVRARHLDTYY